MYMFFAKRYRMAIQLCGERGTNFQSIAARVPVP
jgi:hypothetical protein